MQNSNCSNCAFNDLQPVAMPDGKPVIGQEQLVCKRFPPAVVAVSVPTPQGISVNMMPLFPPVNAEMWCYEWAAENGAQDALEA